MRGLLVLASLLVAASAPIAAAAPVSLQAVRVIRSYPHDRHAFTEGLFYRDGRLFESTGREGQSTIREVRLEDGKVLRSVALPPSLFGEGIVDWKGQLISLTWQTGIGFRWDRGSFRKLGEFHYPGEGWALTRNGSEIVMSDGTPVLRFLDPRTLSVRRLLTVTEDGRPLPNLNELEWVKGEILANVWMTDTIARIDPATGRVKARIDLSSLPHASAGPDDVLNGIAYDAAHDRLFVTGKNWPRLYQIRLGAAGAGR
jgi:glutamine cyclotransferase